MKRFGSLHVGSPFPRALLLLLSSTSFLAGCNGAVVTALNRSPVATIDTPNDGQTFYPGEITLTGRVDDPEDRDASQIDAVWVISGQGRETTCESVPDEDGNVSCTRTLEAGVYSVTLKAVDTKGESDTAKVGFTLFNAAPVATLTPIEDVVQATDLVVFEGTASDLEDIPEHLTARWSSSIEGDLGSSIPDSGGRVRIEATDLTSGDHVITLTVYDSLGNISKRQAVRAMWWLARRCRTSATGWRCSSTATRCTTETGGRTA